MDGLEEGSAPGKAEPRRRRSLGVWLTLRGRARKPTLVMSETEETLTLFKSLICWTIGTFRQTYFLMITTLSKKVPGHSIPGHTLSPHLVLFFTFHSLTLNYTFILYLFIVWFCLWNVSSRRAGTRLFVLSPAVFPAPTMVLSIELGPINISEQIEDKPILCADAFFFFFCIIATDVITALKQKRLKWREINILV